MRDDKDVSLEQMMYALKREQKRSQEDEYDKGKLVTREDGSTAVKVRRKKRRSTQPKIERKEKSTKKKIVMISSGVLLLFLFGIMCFFALGYYNGNGYKNKIKASIESKTGAKSKLSKLNFSPGSASLGKLELDWSGMNGVIQSATMRKVSADLGMLSFLGSGWNGRSLIAQQGTLNLTMPSASQALGGIKRGESIVDFNFEDYRCIKLDVNVGVSKLWSLKEANLEFALNEDDEKQIYLYGGKVNSPIVKNYEILSGLMKIEDESSTVSLNLKPANDSGLVVVKGQIGYKKGSPVRLETTFDKVRLEDWTDNKAGRFIKGTIVTGDGTIDLMIGDESKDKMVINVQSTHLGLTSLPFIVSLSHELKDATYVTPTFRNKSSLTVTKTAAKTVFSKINLVQLSNLQVQGSYQVLANGELSGELRIGVPTVRFSALDSKALRRVFAEDDGLFSWAKVILSGTATHPKDDLNAQFKAAHKGPKNNELTDPLDEFEGF